jgi:site-specific DNA-methyltransferase (cytosine-N4-specific)
MPYRLFPYERELGLRELEQLGLDVIDEQDDAVVVSGDISIAVERATFFDHIESQPGALVPTKQHLVERAHVERRSRIATRQATRYGLHGIHEYKGKFNPQVARALCNIVDPSAEFLIDPFCGSGTALLEGQRLGLDVLGIDCSPMAWFLASVKLGAASVDRKADLRASVARLSRRVAKAMDAGQRHLTPVDLAPALGQAAVDYLTDWFTVDVYAGLSSALERLYAARSGVARNLCLLALSAILRNISLQMPEDLRIRRRPQPFEAPRLAPLFLDATAAICDGLAEMDAWSCSRTPNDPTVLHGSADDRSLYATTAQGKRRLILTSPPYATALPYIDTDRLSIVLLGLSTPSELMPWERRLLGSREWVRAEQKHWEGRRAVNEDLLPSSVTMLLDRIEVMNQDGDAGFRRLAMPSLLYRYFAGMADAMSTWLDVLEPRESAVMIVGHNHTTANGERIDIPTPELLGDIAESRGFELGDLIGLETWPRYGLHSANGVPGEDALVIVRPDP